MEGEDGPAANTSPAVIKAAQAEIGRLDVLVCGQCHSVFHFIEQFQEHRLKEGACSKTSHFRDNGNNEQKAQVWAFLLWKDSQLHQEGAERDSANSWKLYQKWCKMESHVRDTWVTAGKTIQTFVKMANTKMTDIPRPITQNTSDGTKQSPIIVRKVIRNGQPEESSDNKDSQAKIDVKTSDTPQPEKRIIQTTRPRAMVKPRVKPGKTPTDSDEPNQEEFPVERIMAKRFNTKKRCAEYYLKWEGYGPEFNTWESSDVIVSCKFLLDEFERNLAKQKEMKELKAQQLAAQQAKQIQRPIQQQKIIQIKQEPSKPGPSTAAQGGRPMRSSKTKAMDQVKQWCGSMKDEDNDLLGKRHNEFTDSDSEDATPAKKPKREEGTDEDWTGESEEERLAGRSDIIQRALNRANAQSNGSNKTIIASADLATSLGLQSPEGSKTLQSPVLVANSKGVVKVDPKQMPNLASGVYVMSRKEGIIKLDSSPSGKIAVKGSPGTQGVLMVQNRDATVVRKQVITASQANSITPVKVVSKPDGSQVVTQMKVITKPVIAKPRTSLTPKSEPVKIQPKPDPQIIQAQQIHMMTAVPAPLGVAPRMATTTIRSNVVHQQKIGETRPLLPRPAVRGATPTSVLGIGSVRTPVRAPAPKLAANVQRTTIQKRIITTTTQSPVNSPQQMRTKYVVSSGSQIVKTVSPQAKPSPKGINKPSQSLLSPQQKLLMAKRKAQEAVGMAKSPARGVVTTKMPPARGRGKPVAATSTTGKPKETKIVESDGLHMEFQEVGSEDSENEAETEAPAGETAANDHQSQPESPPRPFTLCPLTGRIIGPDGEPVDSGEPEPEQVVTKTEIPSVTTSQTVTSVAVATPENSGAGELVLPSLDALTEAGGIMRVEMSPGGTTGTIVQGGSDAAQISIAGVTVSAPDLPCLDDTNTTSVTTVVPAVTLAATMAESTVTTATIATSELTPTAEVKQEIKQEVDNRVEDSSNLMITGEDGVVYQVAGHAENGQTLLVTRGADGEQQCVYVTSEQPGDDGSVLTLDHAVAEAVAQLMPDQVNMTPQFYVKNEGEEVPADGQMVMSIMDESAGQVAGQEDDGSAQVVAQVVQADDPTPGGTRRVVLLLPDGNLMMTEVDEEQYAALELDK